MIKRAFSVPPDLLGQAMRLSGDGNASALVQRALLVYVVVMTNEARELRTVFTTDEIARLVEMAKVAHHDVVGLALSDHVLGQKMMQLSHYQVIALRDFVARAAARARAGEQVDPESVFAV